MSTRRTTVTLDAAVLDQAQDRYQELGFDRVGELISAAVKDYLWKRELESMHASMAEAARDPRYLEVVRSMSEQFAAIDAEGLPDY